MAILAAGTYRGRAVEGALGETKTGKEQVAVRFALIGDGLAPTQLTWYGYFTDKTTATTFRALRSAGWTGTDLADLAELSGETPEVELVIEHETDPEGKVRARIRWVNGIGGIGLVAPMTPGTASKFAARMRGRLAAYDAGAGTGAPTTPAPAATKPRAKPRFAAPAPDDRVPLDVLDKQGGEQDDDDGIPF